MGCNPKIKPDKLSPEEVAQVLYQVGWRAPELITMLGIGKRESGYNATCWRTNNEAGGTGDFGLFQVNYIHDTEDAQKSVGYAEGLTSSVTESQSTLALRRRMKWLDPVINAKMALYLYHRSGNTFAPWSAGEGGFQAGGNYLHGVDIAAATDAYNRAVKAGMIGQPYRAHAGGYSGPKVITNTNYPGEGIVEAGAGIVDGLASIGSFFSSLTEAHTWVRIAKVVGGIGLVPMGIKITAGIELPGVPVV